MINRIDPSFGSSRGRVFPSWSSLKDVEKTHLTLGFFVEGGSSEPPVANITFRPPAHASMIHRQNFSAAVRCTIQFPQCLTKSGFRWIREISNPIVPTSPGIGV